MNLDVYYKKFPKKEDCIILLEKLRWNNKPSCPYCTSNSYTINNDRYHCNTCNTSYSVTVGTIFHKTRVDLQKWFYVINKLINDNEIISSRELAREINTTKDTAWRILNKINDSLIKQNNLNLKLSNYLNNSLDPNLLKNSDFSDK